MKSKAAGLLVALVFALGFGAGGVAGIASLFGQVNGWWHARSWQPVAAIVTEATLEESYGDTTTYRTAARYRYSFGGEYYEGTRVGFNRGSDNVGDWQRNHYEQLHTAKRTGQSISVWVDPTNPSHSVVDRDLRWPMLAFSLPFAILFPMVSIGALWLVVRILRTPATELASGPKLSGNATEIKSDARAAVFSIWIFAMLWGLIAFPIAFLFIPQHFGHSWWWPLIAVFPLVGIGLIWMAIKRTITWWRNGEVTIALSPSQPQLGKLLTVLTSFSGGSPPGEYKLALHCEQVDARGEDTSYRTVWRQERVVDKLSSVTNCSFSPPAELPASQAPTGLYYRWRVVVNFPHDTDERNFDVVLSEAPQASPAMDGGAAFASEQKGMIARPIPEKIATIVDDNLGLRIDYNPANSRASGIAGMVFGALFTGVGTYLLFNKGAFGAVRLFMGLLFSAIGAGIVAASLYVLTHRRTVEIAQSRLRVVNRWLVGSKHEDYSISQVRELVPTISGTSSVGSKRYDHYQIKVVLHDAHQIVLASGIRDSGVVVSLLKLLQRHLRLTDDAVASVASAGMHHLNRSAPAGSDVADEARILKRKRLTLGVKAVAFLMFGAFAWDFIGTFLEIGNQERTPKVSTAKSVSSTKALPTRTLRDVDQLLFDASVANDGQQTVVDAIAAGANIEATNAIGFTPLLFAVNSEAVDVVRELIDRGANVNFSVVENNDTRGRTALMNASNQGNKVLLKMLLDAGADPSAFERHGWSPIHYSARRGDIEALEIYQRHGVDLDLRSMNCECRGETPLMIAARFGNVATINKLIELGADPRAKDSYGENVYGWAKYFKQDEALEALSQYQ